MAKDDKTKTKAAEAAPEAPATGKKKWILIGVAVLVVLAAAGGGYFYWSSSRPPAKAGAAAAPPPGPSTKLLFHTLEPSFVANFEGLQNFRFLQLQVQVSTRSQETVDLMESIDPVIRNDLLMLFSAQNAEALATREGKEKLRVDSLELVRKAVKNAGGNPGLVENVLFTSFVMQ